jgi:hypothetical protein
MRARILYLTARLHVICAAHIERVHSTCLHASHPCKCVPLPLVAAMSQSVIHDVVNAGAAGNTGGQLCGTCQPCLVRQHCASAHIPGRRIRSRHRHDYVSTDRAVPL